MAMDNLTSNESICVNMRQLIWFLKITAISALQNVIFSSMTRASLSVTVICAKECTQLSTQSFCLHVF